MLAALTFCYWRVAGISHRLRVLLVFGLLLFPALLAVSGRIAFTNENELRASLLRDAYAQLEGATRGSLPFGTWAIVAPPDPGRTGRTSGQRQEHEPLLGCSS